MLQGWRQHQGLILQQTLAARQWVIHQSHIERQHTNECTFAFPNIIKTGKVYRPLSNTVNMGIEPATLPPELLPPIHCIHNMKDWPQKLVFVSSRFAQPPLSPCSSSQAAHIKLKSLMFWHALVQPPTCIRSTIHHHDSARPLRSAKNKETGWQILYVVH